MPLASSADHMLSFEVNLDPGINTFELHHWKWRLAEGRNTALMVTSLNVVPVS